MLTGAINSAGQLEPDDFRSHFPRFQTGNIEKKCRIGWKAERDRIPELGHNTATRDSLGAAQSADIVPVVGTKRRVRLEENLNAAGTRLTLAEIDEIESLVPRGAAAGDRYPAQGMATVNR